MKLAILYFIITSPAIKSGSVWKNKCLSNHGREYSYFSPYDSTRNIGDTIWLCPKIVCDK